VLPIDHGLMLGRVARFEAIDVQMRRFLGWPVDGFLLSAGVLARYSAALGRRRDTSLMLTGDAFYVPWGTNGPSSEPLAHRVISSARRAAALGADVVKLVIFADTVDSARMAEVSLIASAVDEAHSLGLPVIVEPLVSTLCGPSERERYIADACRICAELGADLLKCEYPGDPARMRRLVEDVGVPTMVLGGSLSGDAASVIALVDGALEGGACGVVVGRNLWQREAAEADALVEHLARRIHSVS
jgi:class I fructose-bisphosphate aldolase